ncbi:MAG: YaaA family protein [Eubacteriales bacterium]|nr:YaaA family protein [Eubacteriales bacterium]
MFITASPTKTMNRTTPPAKSLPVFPDETKMLIRRLQAMTPAEIRTAMDLSDKLTATVTEDIRNLRFDKDGLSSIHAFDGLQYKRLDYKSLDTAAREYLSGHLRILSGLYGILRPEDAVYPYRLDFAMKFLDLYHFWGDKIAGQLVGRPVLDLSSGEFSKAIAPYIPESEYHHVTFQVTKNGKRRSAATAAKMMRGRLIRYLAQNAITQPADVCYFTADGFVFDMAASTNRHFIFVQPEQSADK